MMGAKIYPLNKAQDNMTTNFTNCFKFLNMVFVNLTFTVSVNGNMLLFNTTDDYKPLVDTDLALCNHPVHVTIKTDGKIMYGNSTGLPAGTYTLIGMYKYK